MINSTRSPDSVTRSATRVLFPTMGALILALGACSSSADSLPEVEGLSQSQVAQLKELANEGDCTELIAARDFFQIGFSIGELTTTEAVKYAESLIQDANC